MQKEYDARTTNETKYLASQKQLKLARQENQEQQAEMLMLMKRMEDMHSEQAYLKELRGEDSADATDDGGDEDLEQDGDDDDAKEVELNKQKEESKTATDGGDKDHYSADLADKKESGESKEK